MPIIIRVQPRIEDITVVSSECCDLISYVALWRNAREAGSIVGHWQDDQKVLLISDLLVKPDLFISRGPLLPIEKRANFRRLGIGKRLLRAMLDYARQNGANRIYGSVVDQDIQANRDLLDWYASEGFTIRDPDEECLKNAVSKIEIHIEECPRASSLDGHDYYRSDHCDDRM